MSKKSKAVSAKASKGLEKLRKRIDAADHKFLNALAERFGLVEQIGTLKLSQGLPLVQQNRWNEVLKSRIKLGEAKGLGGNFVRGVYSLIHGEALRLQRGQRARFKKRSRSK